VRWRRPEGPGEQADRCGTTEADPAQHRRERGYGEPAVGVDMAEAELTQLTGEQREQEHAQADGTDDEEDRRHPTPSLSIL
jgi:hypothetical protein